MKNRLGIEINIEAEMYVLSKQSIVLSPLSCKPLIVQGFIPTYLQPSAAHCFPLPSQGLLLHSTGLFEFLALRTPAALLFNCHYNGHLVNLPELSSVEQPKVLNIEIDIVLHNISK